MDQVKISADDHTTAKDFREGNPVQVRVQVNEDDTHFKKGRIVKVLYGNRETDAVIVSDPLIVSVDPEKKSKVLSLIVEQDNSN